MLRNKRKGYVQSFSQYQIDLEALFTKWCCPIARLRSLRSPTSWGRPSPARGLRWAPLVRSHGVAGAHDRASGNAPDAVDPHARQGVAAHGARPPLRAGSRCVRVAEPSLRRSSPHLRSGDGMPVTRRCSRPSRRWQPARPPWRGRMRLSRNDRIGRDPSRADPPAAARHRCGPRRDLSTGASRNFPSGCARART